MECRIITYSLEGYSRSRDLQIEIVFSDNVKISEQTVNKALMIAMNYLIENMEIDKLENMETDKQESAE